MKSFTPNPRAACRTLALLLVAHGLAFVSPAAEFIVGPDDHRTLQAAVDAAAAVGNNDAQNVILIRAPVLFTTAAVQIGAQFNGNRQLVIRPDPSVPDLPRVTIISENGFEPIVLLAGAGHVTLQDLDLVRQTTNNDDLLQIIDGTSNVVERCRIGSDWPTASLAEWSHVRIERPVEVIVRNCVCFARLPGNLARGISVLTGTAQNHSVFLYNNTVADFGLYGIQIEASGSSFVLLRNNVVVNHRDLATEPTAFHSHVSQDVDLQTSHNTAFASEASVELLDVIAGVAADSIAGAGGLLRLERPATDAAFRETEWKLDVGWNGNHDLFRLRNGGPLHGGLADAGAEVRDADPHARDKAVNDDWERDPRHTGDPSRTDRGADQFAQLTVGDIEVILPRIPVFTGVSVGSNGAQEPRFDVGPQTDLPGNIPADAMSGGEFSVAGSFVSIDTLRVAGFNELRLVPSLAFGGGNFMLSWTRTVRGVFVQASTDLDSWSTLFGRPVVNGEMMSVTLPTTGPERFFRLASAPPTLIAPTQLPPDPTKPHGQIAAIRDRLNGLVARNVLPERQALSLRRELDGSLAWLRRARVEPSLLELGRFRTTIEALVRNGTLPTVDADPLLALVTTPVRGISTLRDRQRPDLEPGDYCGVSVPAPPCPASCAEYTQYHVNPHLVEGDRDGSEERPFRTITDALAQAALVGTDCVRIDVLNYGHTENLVITRNTWIRGSIPAPSERSSQGRSRTLGRTS